jgi:UDP-N-acetylmuramate--alanine ligase
MTPSAPGTFQAVTRPDGSVRPAVIAAQVRPTTLFPNASARPTPAMDFKGRRIHFMGAGGIGVSALMELCLARGAVVSGCDCASGGQVAALRAKGLRIESGHCASHVAGCDELVHTAAVDDSHPEVRQARREGLSVTPRMRMLGCIARGTRAVCVTGAHGKTSTTWLIAHLLIAGRRDPSVLLGGVVGQMNGNVRIGKGGEFVAEVDESDNKLHEVTPVIPVLTNIDNDHLEHYGTVDRIEEAATRFMASVDASDPMSVLIGCGDDPRVRRVLMNAAARCRRPVLSYGIESHNDMRALNVRSEGQGWRFDVLGPFGLWTEMDLPMPGEHNVLNALAAISVAWQLGLSCETIRTALAGVERVGRRFEIKGVVRGVRVVDDYGHHPTEIALTLRAARATTSRLGILFQPHRYTRTMNLMREFSTCFQLADKVLLLPVYAASEQPIEGADHLALAGAIRATGFTNVVTVGSRAEAVALALAWAKPGDTLLTQGAGDITKAGDELVSGL